MRPVDRRTLDWIYSLVLLAIVVLSWGCVIYASAVAAARQLERAHPDRGFGANAHV